MINALGYFTAGFLLVGLYYNPVVVFMVGIYGMALCAALLPFTIGLWIVIKLIKEIKA
jgi:hypothetical protein